MHGDTPARGERFRAGVVAVFAIAIMARAAAMYYANTHPERFDYPDSRRYVAVARHIARGDGPIESWQNRTGTDPLYPYLLSPACYRDSATIADVYAWARVVNVVLGLVGLAAVMGIGKRFGGPGCAVVAGLIYAVDPILVFFNALPLTEVPFMGLFWSGIYLLTRSAQRPSPLLAVLAGGLLGAGVLTRSSSLPLAFAMPLVAALVSTGKARERIVVLLFAWMAAGIAVSPAWLRNRQVLGHWTAAVRTGSGASLLEALGPWADGGPGMEKVRWPSVSAGADEAERDAVYRDAAAAWAWAHPTDVLRLAAAKARRTWSVTLNAPGYGGGWYAVVGWISVSPVYALAAAGLLMVLWRRGDKRRGGVWLLLAPAIYFTLVHMVFVGSVRYRVPTMPGLYVLAGVAVVDLMLRHGPKRPLGSNTTHEHVRS